MGRYWKNVTAPKACPLDELRVEATIENVRRILADIGGGLFVTVFYGVLDGNVIS